MKIPTMYTELPKKEVFDGPVCPDVIFAKEKIDPVEVSNIYTEASWGKIIENIEFGPLYLIGSPHPVELYYIQNTLLITTVTYEYKRSLSQLLSSEFINLTTLRVLDYELHVPQRSELQVMKNIFITKESKSLLKLLTWTYYLCHYQVPCKLIGDHEMFQPLIDHSQTLKHIIRLVYDNKKRDLCWISLDW